MKIYSKLGAKSYFLNTLKKLNGIDYYEKIDIVYVIQIELEDEITKIVDNFAYQRRTTFEKFRSIIIYRL